MRSTEMKDGVPRGTDAGPGIAARFGDRRAMLNLALVAVFCVLWSSAFAAAKIGIVDCPPLILLSARFLAAGIIMIALAVATGALRALPRRRDLVLLVALGALNNAVYLGLSWVGMETVSSGFAAVIISANPLLTALIAAPVLGERLGVAKLAGLALGLAGVAIVVRSRIAGGEGLFGTALVCAALLSLVAGTIVFKRFVPRVDLWTGNAVQCLAGGVLLAPVALMTASPADIHLTANLVWSFAYMVVAVSIGAYWLWFYLLSKSSATAAASLHFLMPPLGLMFGWLLLGEPVAAADLLGIVPIAIGIRLVTRPTRGAAGRTAA